MLEADANRPSCCVGFVKNPLLQVRTEATACQHFTCGSENSVIQAGDANYCQEELFSRPSVGPDLKSVYTSRQ